MIQMKNKMQDKIDEAKQHLNILEELRDEVSYINQSYINHINQYGKGTSKKEDDIVKDLLDALNFAIDFIKWGDEVMIKYFCDRCGKELDRSYRAHISYSGNEEAYFCKECNEEFLNWMKNKPDDRLIEQTAALHKAQDASEWWSNQCNEIYKDCAELFNKVEEIMAHGSVR